jgi:transposase
MFRRMKSEAPDKKWSRLRAQVQEGITKAYPNRERKGCPNRGVIIDLARRSAQFDDSIEEDPQWQHVTHCSPCYTQYLEEFQIQRKHKPPHRTH